MMKNSEENEKKPEKNEPGKEGDILHKLLGR